MTLKQMAAWNVAKFMGTAFAVGLLTSVAIDYLGLNIVGTLFAACILVYMLRLCYKIEVDKLERENSLKKIKDSQ